MEEMYYYLEDQYDRFIVYKGYMKNEYNHKREFLIMCGSLFEIYDYIDQDYTNK